MVKLYSAGINFAAVFGVYIYAEYSLLHLQPVRYWPGLIAIGDYLHGEKFVATNI